MSTKENDIWLEAQEELKAEYENTQVNISEESLQDIPEGELEPAKLSQAVEEEQEESEVSRLAHENCTPEDYS